MSAGVVVAALLALQSPREVQIARAQAEAHGALGAGVMLGAVSITLRWYGTAIAFTKQADGFDPGAPKGTGLRVIGGVVGAGSVALVGHGSHALGQLWGLQGRAAKRRPALGWTLVGVGAAVIVASRTVPLACFSNPCALATSEGAFTAGFVLAGTGLGLGTFSVGYRQGAGRQWTVRPRVSRGFAGLGVSGRF